LINPRESCSPFRQPEAVRALDQLPPRVVPAVIEFLFGPIADNPQRVGKPLRDDFAGLHSAHRGAYRVLYEINDAVTVVRVADRAYRAR
jgi:mRNA-degrading endonuclease RelE of RelBE toxin-antitoxin system